MKRLWPLLALLFVAATADETRLYRTTLAAFNDRVHDVAERQAADFLAKFPKSGFADRVALILGQSQLQNGNWEAAAGTLENALVQWPAKSPDVVRYWLGEAWLRGGKLADAEARFAEVIANYPRSEYRSVAAYGAALARFRQQKFAEAAESLAQLAKLGFRDAGARARPDLPIEADLLRAQIDLAQQRYADAATAFTTLIERQPDTAPALRARLWRAEAFRAQNQVEPALADVAAILATYDKEPGRLVDATLAAQAAATQGGLQAELGRFRDAAAAYQRTLQLADTPGLRRVALVKLGETLIRGGQPDEGIAQLKEFLAAHPGDPLTEEIRFFIGELRYNRGEFAAATTELKELLQLSPNTSFAPRATYLLGLCAGKLQKPAEAAEALEQVIKLTDDPTVVADALYKIGDARFALKQFGPAAAAYQQLLDKFPRYQHRPAVLLQLGDSHRRTRNWPAALATLEQLTRDHADAPQAAEAQFAIAQIHAAQQQEPAARAALARLVESHPTSPWAQEARLALGESLYREQQYAAARQHFESLLTPETPTNLAHRAFYQRGWCLDRLGEGVTVLADFTAFLKDNPQSALAVDIQFWIANHHYTRQAYLKAQEEFLLLVRSYPRHALTPTAQFYAGRSAYLRQDYKGAIEVWETLVKNFPDSPWRVEARFAQGDAYTELGQFEDALVVFDNVVTLFPDTPRACDAQGRKGDCLFTLHRFEEAASAFRKATECAREPAARNQAFYKLGQSLERRALLDDALQAYAAAVYDVPTNTEAPPERFWSCKAIRAAASVKEQQQQWRDAITFYQKLASACPDLRALADDRIRKLRVEHVILY